MSEVERALARGSFERACEAAPGELRRSEHTVGGRRMTLSIVGADLHALLSSPALPMADGPERADDRSTALEIRIWDQRASGVGPGALPPPIGEATEGNWPLSAMASAPPLVRFWGPEFELELDRSARRLYGSVRDTSRLRESWHPGRPLHGVLMPWLADLGLVVIHGGCVADAGGGILLAGTSGSGKSTSTVACGMAGMSLLGDDAIAVSSPGASGERPLAYCVNASAKLTVDGTRRQPAAARFAQRLEGEWAGDAALLLREIDSIAVAESAPLRAILFPRLAESRESRLVPLSRARALALLTGCDLTMAPGRVGIGFETMSTLVECLPVATLEVGTDPEGIPVAVEQATELRLNPA